MKKHNILKKKRSHPSKRHTSLTMLEGAQYPGGSRVSCLDIP